MDLLKNVCNLRDVNLAKQTKEAALRVAGILKNPTKMKAGHGFRADV